ncbi:ARM repeat-containing protein [Parathielavia appendiculata]|uniref:ARM repeat-containing protein n=1 Tax=Parathielavia appendiculata TaxID=2587402 RepID=A0AAN6U0B7_9PEZI|nr:ARM repeat-containing protein [Parathielavia appendiculata]
MASVSPLAQRTNFFQQLKRVCVPLSQLALRPKDKAVDSKEVLRLLEALIDLWAAQAAKDVAILDEKLADYVFFPLSYLLRDRGHYSMRVIEAIIRLLRELIQHGWKAKASPQLFQQLLVFLSFVIGGVPDQPKPDMPEETIIEGFRTLAALVSIAQPSHLAASPDSSPERRLIPALGHSVTVMLDGMTEGVASSVQLEAVECLRAVFTTIKDNTTLAQFLPGTVSALAKVLSPPRANHTQRTVILSCLDLLQLVLVNVLSDIKVRGTLKELETLNQANTNAEATSVAPNPNPPGKLTASWLRATAAQVKIALAAILRLRSHKSDIVQAALHRLCIALLDQCHSSLVDCQSMLVESAMVLEEDDDTRSRHQTSLQDLAGVYPELVDSMKSALYHWITGLPRVMQSSDERVKHLAIRSILRGSKLSAAMQMDSSTLDDALGDSLRDSIISLIRSSKQPRIVDDTGADVATNTDLVRSGLETATYSPVLLGSESQKATRKEISALISSIGSPAQQIKLAASMLGHVRDSQGVNQVASFWLAFELLKSTYAQSSEIDDLLDLSSLGQSRHQEETFRELYDFSASVLSAHSDAVEEDWRIEAIALEVAAFAASRLQLDFRPELIDVLYPVTTFLGSQSRQLRAHAITTLNIIAASCGYDSVSDLIVDNADYMVNSIALRLNTFDISPASTKVLTMVIRLTGPRLIPFLDDVVAAIFAALDNYHGYPVFVESLFSVLSEVVTQGVKSDMLLLADANHKAINHRKKKAESAGIPSILETLTKRLERATRSKQEEEEEEPILPLPQQHWGPAKDEATSLLEKLTNPDSDQDADSDETEPPPPADQSLEKPKTPTYTLLTRVLSLTQHHLTSPSPTLRKSLLELVATVSPALAPDENAFLPLIHAVWPVVLARLYDPEPYVAVAACGALAGLCRAAGDFLGSRFKTEWWGALGRWVRKVRADVYGLRMERMGKGKGTVGRWDGGGGRVGEGILVPLGGGGGGEGVGVVKSSSPAAALGRFSQASQVWEAALGLLTAIVGYVRLEDDMFDDILGLVLDVLPRHGELREALETVNADAVWLALYERGLVQERDAPVVEGFEFRFARMEGRGAVEAEV